MSEEKRCYYPLTPPQSQLLASRLASLDRASWLESNIITFYFKVASPVDTQFLEKAYWEVIRANDALRIRMERHGLGLRQYIAPFAPSKLEIRDFPSEEAATADLQAMRCKHVISWEAESLIWARIALYPGGATLQMRAHHACLDGFSLSLIITQLHDCYAALRDGKEMPELKTGSVVRQFEDSIAYHRSEQHKKDLRFFAKAFLTQPHYRMPGRRLSFVGDAASENCYVEGETYRKLMALSREWGVSPQLLVQCAVALTVHKLTGAYNFALGTLVHGRRDFKAKKTVGCMMNNTVVFYLIKKDDTLADFVSKHQVSYLSSLEHSHLPFAETLIPSYKEGIFNGFNFNHCWLLFSSMDYANALAEEGFSAGALTLPTITYQMYLAMLEHKDKCIQMQLSYQTRVFKAQEITHIMQTFTRIVDAIVTNPQDIVKNIIA